MEGYRVLQASDGQSALNIIATEAVDLLLTDLLMPKISGEILLRRVVDTHPLIPVVVLTGHGSIENAVTSMRQGAYDFLTKPVNLDRLSLVIRRALESRKIIIENKQLQQELARHKEVQRIVGKSSKIQHILSFIDQVASVKASVLITGESGVGKELIADALHNLSTRKDNPFIKVHCAALSESLLESELFGHEKGAFTGAIAQKKGRFELAHTGSIFLDEIGDIPLSTQVKILRVLQERTFERVGGEQSIQVDVRIISATNCNLEQRIQEGTFRQDLFYRLNVVNIHVPPLRERKEDVPFLVSHFIREFAQENNKNIEGADQRSRAMLYNYSWPGNIRELRNCIESAVALAKGPLILPKDLPPYLHAEEQLDVIRIPQGASLVEAEREIIRATLFAHKGNKSKAARTLGIGRKTLHRKIQLYSLEN
ncbi:hypothetical protein LSH36_583g02041 [Paralvinella palmiformis]|uniref:Transcriptional regulator n=1 Tax=Paralvinella palmiformis TaxID=53620 RepID=A0AAD9J5K3_9ANNE|nr:hypothetical protein LSH36_583g02041 [Paralvinella palmiformis]